MTDSKDFSVTTAGDGPAVHLIFLWKMLVTHPPTCNYESQLWNVKATVDQLQVGMSSRCVTGPIHPLVLVYTSKATNFGVYALCNLRYRFARICS